MMYTMVLGIEHLMTGISLLSESGNVISFERESASTVRAVSSHPFMGYWPLKQSYIQATERDEGSYIPIAKHTAGEAEWYAQVMATKMADTEGRLFSMQTYTRPGDSYTGENGVPSRYATGEPAMFPWDVIQAMRAKFGKDIEKWLAALRWDHDHWFFIKDGMYHGVEPDGHIHT